jgi:hypothetical protein
MKITTNPPLPSQQEKALEGSHIVFSPDRHSRGILKRIKGDRSEGEKYENI